MLKDSLTKNSSIMKVMPSRFNVSSMTIKEYGTEIPEDE